MILKLMLDFDDFEDDEGILTSLKMMRGFGELDDDSEI